MDRLKEQRDIQLDLGPLTVLRVGSNRDFVTDFVPGTQNLAHTPTGRPKYRIVARTEKGDEVEIATASVDVLCDALCGLNIDPALLDIPRLRDSLRTAGDAGRIVDSRPPGKEKG